MASDNASRQVIDQTSEQWRNQVRLYFRPKTPTQFNNEGFRPVGQRGDLNAHCGVPVFFVFDAYSVLSRADSKFSDGNLASSRSNTFSNASEFAALPFEHIYHEGTFKPEERDEIVLRRNAEVVVPNQLDLDSLRFIVCRSQAEYETFLYMMPESERSRWGDKVQLDAASHFFNKRWLYLETAESNQREAILRFKPNPMYAGPFDVEILVVNMVDGSTNKEHLSDYFAADVPMRLNFGPARRQLDYLILILIDGSIAYMNRYQEGSSVW
jgi:hypothetical protein